MRSTFAPLLLADALVLKGADVTRLARSGCHLRSSVLSPAARVAPLYRPSQGVARRCQARPCVGSRALSCAAISVEGTVFSAEGLVVRGSRVEGSRGSGRRPHKLDVKCSETDGLAALAIRDPEVGQVLRRVLCYLLLVNVVGCYGILAGAAVRHRVAIAHTFAVDRAAPIARAWRGG